LKNLSALLTVVLLILGVRLLIVNLHAM